jgi:hypothetical protein
MLPIRLVPGPRSVRARGVSTDRSPSPTGRRPSPKRFPDREHGFLVSTVVDKVVDGLSGRCGSPARVVVSFTVLAVGEPGNRPLAPPLETPWTTPHRWI